MKKWLLAIAFLFAAAAPAASAGQIELRFGWWGGGERHEATLAAIKMFEESHPGVTIKAEYMGWDGYLERLTTQLGSGSAADLVQMDWAWLATFSKDGNGFYNLFDAGAKVNTAAYDQKWLDMCIVNGRLNALPVSFTTRYFLWNKTTFDKAGVAIPQTWEDWVNAGPVFKEKLGDEYYPIDFNLNAVTHMLQSYIFQKTGHMVIDPATNKIGLTMEEMTDMFAFYKRLLDNHAITTIAVRSGRSGDANSQIHEQPDYIEGKWAGNYSWDSSILLSLSTPKGFEFVVGPWLQMPGQKNSGRIGRPAQIMAVSKNSKNPELAAEFLSFLLTSPESARVLKTTRGTLIAKPAMEELQRMNLIAQPNIEADAQLVGVQTYTASPYFEDPRVLRILDETVENVSYEKLTPAQAAEHIFNELPRLLDRLTR